MLADDAFLDFFVFPVAAGFALFLLGLTVRAGVQTLTKRTKEQEDGMDDVESLSRFFFGRKANRRTGVPEEQGWTSQVDETLRRLTEGQESLAKGQDDQKELLRTVQTTVEQMGEAILAKQDLNGNDHS